MESTTPKQPAKKISSAKQLESIKEAGKWDAGSGLRLVVDQKGNKRWVLRYQINGERREMGLGSYPEVGLKSARDQRDALKVGIAQGIDPLDKKEADKKARQEAAAKETTFKETAIAYIKAHRAGWKNAKHAQQWENTLNTYAYPYIGHKAVGTINSEDVLSVLSPIWKEKPETAARVRNRIELVLDAARAKGLREGENPARWRGYLDKLLPPRSKVRAVKNHPAMPMDELPAFMADLMQLKGSACRALNDQGDFRYRSE
ncbi:Prophage integrase IntS [compost metagenome]